MKISELTKQALARALRAAERTVGADSTEVRIFRRELACRSRARPRELPLLQKGRAP